MRFRATENQVKQIAVNACKAQLPLVCQHLKPDFFEVDEYGLVVADTVKLIVRRVGVDRWEIDDELDRHWHGWIDAYPTVQALVHSVVKSNDRIRDV